jgi:abortive infection bacteriophage resistance protein
MSYSPYNKPYKSPQEIITGLKTKELRLLDEPKAERTLADINYYRFKVYLRPLMIDSRFDTDYTFEDGVALYRFDDELRDLLFSIIGRVEVKLRTKLDQVITLHTADPYWYLDNTLFSNKSKIAATRSGLGQAFQRSSDEFAVHFKANSYNEKNDDFKSLPPFWMVSELATFGNLLAIFSALDKVPFQTDPRLNVLDRLAQQFGARNLKELNSWLTLIRDVRNRCAHHSRTWNFNFREPSGLRNLLAAPYLPSHQNRIYLFMAMLQQMTVSLNMNIKIKDELLKLICQYPIVSQFLHAAGFPVNWEDNVFWD